MRNINKNTRSDIAMRRNRRLLMATMVFGCALSSNQVMANLVVNGDFEAGNTGFTTQLNFGSLAEGAYVITPNANNFHSAFGAYGDHTSGTGNLMAVNGSTTANQIVWSETISVTANTQYDFASYLLSYSGTNNPASLAFSINSTDIGTLNASTTKGVWDLFFTTWNSGPSTTATISILNKNTAGSGNDFALDDIYFGAPTFSSGSPVPLPPALTLMGIGLGILGIFGKRSANDTLAPSC